MKPVTLTCFLATTLYYCMSVVLSIRDIEFELNPNACYHSLFKDAAKDRIINKVQDATLQRRIRYALEQPRASTVWGLVFETANGPYVIQNLKYAHVSPAFRRVLCIY